MKKLTLESNAFNKGEVLSRTQLKKVMGGLEREGGSGDYLCFCQDNPEIMTITPGAEGSQNWGNSNCGQWNYTCEQLPSSSN